MPDEEFVDAFAEPQDTPDVEIVLPPLISASDLLPPEEEEIPPEPGEQLIGAVHGQFVTQRTPRGDGWSDYIVHEDDAMEPVGVWAAREYPDLSGPDLAAALIEAGLPQERAVYYGRLRVKPPEVEIPPDIEAVWGGGRLDGTGMPAINTARVMIDKHGVEGFRKSALHQAALAEIDHFKQKDAFSRAFVAAQNKKGAK